MAQGIISVSTALFEKQKQILGETTIIDDGEPIKQPQTLAEWHTLLMLPEEYKVLEAKADAVYPLWLITVENEAIPVIEGKKLPGVTPYFIRVSQWLEDKPEDVSYSNHLDRIEIDVPERRVIWPREEQAQ